MSDPVHARIDELVKTHRVVLFMKGTRARPQCGFSASVVNILDDYLEEYVTVDVLGDASVREGVKKYSDWPTLPQLFVEGRFVGGADIVKEMRESGELGALLGASELDAPEPEVRITDAARAALLEARQPGDPPCVRIEIDGAFQHGLLFDHPRPGDVELEGDALAVVMDRASARRADGLVIDFVQTPTAMGFKIDNPNEPPRVRPIEPKELRALLDAGAPVTLVDVRTVDERAIARIEPSRLLDDAMRAELERLDPDTRLVFYCHHGVRSRAAAEHCVKLGLRNVWNLAGGIDAWSREVDPGVPRY